MSMFCSEYARRGAELVRRIERLIPEHPEILAFESPAGLLGMPGFVWSDLEPPAQAAAALEAAVERHRKAGRG